MAFEIGERVRWTSSNTTKEGVVTAIVPPGQKPQGMKDTGMSRDHESYVVRGGEPGAKKTADYWPRVSLLVAAGGLSAAEITWCHENADKVRALIAAAQ